MPKKRISITLEESYHDTIKDKIVSKLPGETFSSLVEKSIIHYLSDSAISEQLFKSALIKPKVIITNMLKRKIKDGS